MSRKKLLEGLGPLDDTLKEYVNVHRVSIAATKHAAVVADVYKECPWHVLRLASLADIPTTFLFPTLSLVRSHDGEGAADKTASDLMKQEEIARLGASDGKMSFFVAVNTEDVLSLPHVFSKAGRGTSGLTPRCLKIFSRIRSMIEESEGVVLAGEGAR